MGEHSAEVVGRLLSHGANVNGTDVHGNTALMTACVTGNEDVVQYLLNDEKIRVKVDKQNNQGWTAAHFAYCESDLAQRRRTVDMLVGRGGNSILSIADKDNLTPEQVRPKRKLIRTNPKDS